MVQNIEMPFAPYDRAMLDVHSLCGSWAFCCNLLYFRLIVCCFIVCVTATLVVCCRLQSLASQLKAQLEAARNAKSTQNVSKRETTSEDSEMVVLSRTDRQGMSRPLPARKHAVEPKRGRRKKEKVSVFVSVLCIAACVVDDCCLS